MWRIAIFDDNPIVLESLTKSINWASMNCNVCGCAATGSDALSVLKSLQPHIVITDVMMPEHTGLDLAAFSQQYHFNTKFIIITGFSNAEVARQSVRLKVFDYISKPIDNEEIKKVVLEAIESFAADPGQEEEDPVTQVLSSVYRNISSYSPLICDVIRYVEQQYTQTSLSLSNVASHFYVSVSHLSNRFKEETSVGFITFVTMIRLNQAKKILKDPHVSISQVAYQVGYKDYGYFFQVFKKHYGYAPGTVRGHE